LIAPIANCDLGTARTYHSPACNTDDERDSQPCCNQIRALIEETTSDYDRKKLTTEAMITENPEKTGPPMPPGGRALATGISEPTGSAIHKGQALRPAPFVSKLDRGMSWSDCPMVSDARYPLAATPFWCCD